MKVYLKKNVYESALDRIRWVFKEFNNEVCIGFSGGKDSTAVLELSLIVVRELKEKGIIPKDYKLKVMWLDQEAEWTETVKYCERVMERDEVDFYRMQLPMRMGNNASFEQSFVDVWDEDLTDEELLNPRHPKAYHEMINDDGSVVKYNDRFGEVFEDIYTWMFQGKPYAVLQGLKANENIRRNIQLTAQPGYKNITWATSSGRNKEGVRFSPIYDWNNVDNWVAVSKFGWDYNKIYDKMWQYGTPIHELRVSNLIHETSVAHHSTVAQELDPELYERMTQRIKGISTYSKMQSDAQKVELPVNFSSWREYKNYLIDKLIPEKNKNIFYNLENTKFYKENVDDEIEKAIIESVLTADLDGTKFRNIAASRDLKNRKERIKSERRSKKTNTKE